MPGTRRSSLVGAVLLVALGLLFLYSNFRPGLDPWPLLSRYWPLLLISLGLGKVWDQFRPRDSSQAGRAWLERRRDCRHPAAGRRRDCSQLSDRLSSDPRRPSHRPARIGTGSGAHSNAGRRTESVWWRH